MNKSRYDFDVSGLEGGSRGEPIAIIGAAGRFPQAPDVDAFWANLLAGRDCVSEIPDDRWNKAQLYHPEKGQRGKAYTFAAGVLGDVSRFDPGFFGISPREALQMDPQQRLLLELAYEATEDAGLDVARLAGEAVGVFVGGSSWDYLNLHVGDVSTTDAYSMIGITLSPLSNRISYVFDLRGPSFTVDTACSSSLVALHQACEAIRQGEIGMALVGGVSLLLAPQSFVGFCAASMLSPNGRCHAFDARADGYVRAEGGGIAVLKPLGAALAAGDPIRAVIRGTGVNSDGRTTGFSLPNRQAQAALLRHVYDRFELDPAHLAYVEAHGTGTPAGDPIEAGALGEVLGGRRTDPLPIGSVKTNIGHLEAGSGMAGLIKAMLVAERGVIPPSLHCETPNPNIPFADLNLRLAPSAIELPPRGSMPRLVGVNSFGFGGTNAHAVLETADPLPLPSEEAPAGSALPPLLLSARSEEALKEVAAGWHNALADAPSALPALVRGAALRRSQHKRRLAIPAGSEAEMIEALDAFVTGKAGAAAANNAVTGGVAFIFSGNGSQWAGMAADAIEASCTFRSALARVDAALAPWLGWSVAGALDAPDADRLRDTEVAQPLLFAVQVALVMALREQGLEPDACMGHSVGEVAAAWATGALDLDAAARVIAARSRAQQTRHGVGGMAVIGLDATAAADAIAQTPGCDLAVAAHNSSQGTTVAGSSEGLDALDAAAKEKGWRYTRLDLEYAFHSPAMDPIAPLLAHDLEGLKPQAGRLPFFSTVTGEAIEGGRLDADYWWHNVREPVRFAEAARAMVDQGLRIFVEIGPHSVLQAYLNDALRLADREGRVLPTLSRRPIKHDPVATIAARAHAAGADIRGANAFIGPATARGLPRYPWQRERFWLEPTAEATDQTVLPFEHPLLGIRLGDEPSLWTRHIGLELQPWLADHAVGGAAVVPAAALIDMALAAGRARSPAAGAIELIDVEIGRALVVEPQVLREVRLRIGSSAGDFEISSRPRLTLEPWIVHVAGRLAAGDAARAAAWVLDGAVERRMGTDALYALAASMGLEYGPAFRPVSAVEVGANGSATVRFDGALSLGAGFLLPPNLTDGAMQGLLALAADRLGTDGGVLPWRFGRIRLLAPEGAAPASAQIRISRVGPRSVRADVQLLAADGAVVAEMADCWFVRVALGRGGRAEGAFFHTALIGSVPAGDAPALPSDLDAVLGAAVTDPAAEESRLLADAFVAAAAIEALGTIAEAGRLQPQELIRSGRIAVASRPLLDQLLRWLAEDGAADQGEDGAWRLQPDALPAADAILRTLFFDAPRGIAEVALLALAAETLPTLLRDGPDALPPLPASLRDQLLSDSPAGAAAAAALAERVGALVDAREPGRPLRILEVGARRGAFTTRLLRRIAGADVQLTAATSPDDLPTLADRLRDRPATRAIAWNPGEALENAPFDLIVGSHALTLAGTTELAAFDRLLAPGGLLLLAEPSPSRLWRLLGLGATPPVDGARWQSRLESGGFVAAASTALATPLWPVELIAARAGGSAAPAAAPMALTLVSAAGCGWAADIAGRLTEANASVEPRLLGDLPELLASWDGMRRLAVVLPDGAIPTLAERLALVAQLATIPSRDTAAPVDLITAGTGAGDPATAALIGAARVLANEAPHVALRLIRIDPALADGEAADRVAAELLQPDGESEVAWDRHGRHVPRVRRGLPQVARAAEALRLTVERPGLLDSLGWTTLSPAQPGPGELAIRIEAAGLNFRDVMWAMGLLPDEALLDGFAGPTLGLECAGTVTAVGEGVSGFAAGDRVMAFAPASLSTHTVTAAHAVMRMPDGLDFAAAATIPVAFLTVAYSLGTLAQLTEGETVLIHGGAGGVGLAAIQYARARGARVFATAGSPAKRALLATLGVEAVLDSRSLAFADEVLRLTDGAGVDVVLNSLSGEAMRRSLALVKPFGRFLELGKRDFYENSAVGLRPFRHNVSYFGIDADQLPLRRPKLAAALFDEIAQAFADGRLRPLPHRVYDFADAEEAFRLMQASGHIGKVVLAPGAVLPRPIAAPAPFAADPAKSYVVTGGLAGFGLEAARWLVRNGAKHLALLGRRGAATPGADEALAAFAQAGVDARAYAVDIADEAALAGVLDQVREQAPIGGVVHAAVAMDDALLTQLDAPRFARALAPKLGGAEALDRLTRGDAIDLFLLFSSVTTPMGNPGQGNYVAANAAIEALAERRHAAGLPALAVQWGPIGDAGYLAREAQVSEMLAKQLGGQHLTAAEALDQLPALLAAGTPVVGLAPVRWGALRNRLPLLATPLFAEMDAAAADEAGEVDLKALLSQCGPDEARERVTGLLIEEVARIMKLAPDRVEAHRPLAELGMDSLMAVELRLAVEQRFGVTVPLLALAEGATLSAMAARIVRGFSETKAAEPADQTAQLADRLAQFEGSGIAAPADHATAPSEPGFAAAAVTTP